MCRDKGQRPVSRPVRTSTRPAKNLTASEAGVRVITPVDQRGGENIFLSNDRIACRDSRDGLEGAQDITDLRFGNVVDEDWNKRDRFARSSDRRVAVPLPEGVLCFAVAAAMTKQASHYSGRVLGDGIVPLASALARHANPRLALVFDESRQRVIYGINHLELLSRSEVCDQIKQWLAA